MGQGIINHGITLGSRFDFCVVSERIQASGCADGVGWSRKCDKVGEK